MNNVGQLERATQNRVVKLFRDNLGYDYLGNWEEREDNSNIEEKYLRTYLVKQGCDDNLISKAIFELTKVAGDQTKSLYDVNHAVHDLLRYGVKVLPEVGAQVQTVHLINWKEPLKNHFAIAEEVTYLGKNIKRPDIVLYVNGIAVAVLELKRSIVSVTEGIRQNLDNQKPIFIERFFTTIQLIMAGSDTEGLRYAVIETPEKYYLTWKEEPPAPASVMSSGVETSPAPFVISSDSEKSPSLSRLDQELIHLCAKERLLELVHDFIAFDSGVKKAARPNQYFGVKAAQARVRARQGGIIWHTQGSGKSLTMVWLAKWIRENITNSRVLIITDRKELDQQIEGVFLGVREDIYRCKSGADLIAKLNDANPPLLCSLIHKFGKKQETDYEGYIADLQNSLPPNFSPRGDLYVFVDECHRTQSGKLHEAMKKILPNAIFIGFTGTPLLAADKQKSIEIFGSYIHTYKFNQAVKDGVILDLRYEARDIDQSITSPDKIDAWFNAKTKGLTPFALADLKKRWGTMQKVLSSQSRLEKIVADILLDMETKDRLESGRGNAMLVAGSIYQACKLYELFLDAGFTRCAIVTSYVPTTADLKGEETGEGYTENLKQYDIYQKMLNGQDVEQFEKDVKWKFIHEPGQMKLLIVVDKLLTGFDAPPATYLYIDKTMRDHGLFQAICRVNRLDGDDKEFGYIIDYKDLFKSLEKSVNDYTGDAFDNYDKADVEGLLTDRLTRAKEHLEEARESIKALVEPVPPPQDQIAYLHYFCGADTTDPDERASNEPRRLALYKQTAALLRAYANLANEMDTAGYTPQQAEQIKAEVTHFEQVRLEVKLASADYIDLKAYEPAMRHLLDTYIRAEDSTKISAFDDIPLVKLIVERGAAAIDALPDGIKTNRQAVAETIENNLRRVIVEGKPTNPKYYEKMSTLLDELTKSRRAQALEYQTYLERVVELSKQVDNPNTGGAYPSSLNTAAKRALYDNLGKDETTAVELDYAIRHTKKDNWRGNIVKEREVKYVVGNHVPADQVDSIFDLIYNQPDY